MAVVTCTVCGKKLDYTKEQAVKSTIKRRYCHYSCYPEGELVPMTPPKKTTFVPKIKKETQEPSVDNELFQEEKNLVEYHQLLDFCKETFGDEANYPMIQKQTKHYIEDLGYTRSGILKTLQYWYNVAGGDPKEARGAIGIVPYVFDQAKKYYYEIFLAQEANKDVVYKPRVEVVTIPSPRMNIKKHFFNLDEDEE